MIRSRVPHPVFRKLRVFAIDSGMTARFETAVLNETTLAIPWETLEPGPVGEYVAVVDEDAAGKRIHASVDLDRPEILAQDGLPPSDGNPQFRQQMVYAVAMRTIRTFEGALGRKMHWRTRPGRGGQARIYEPRLRLSPHAMEEPNALYDPERGVLFGYFRSVETSVFPGTTVFTCLSQDVISHTVTHALLDGMGISFQGRHPDVAALHEAFSDLVALLQHFSPSEVLRHQIAAVRGRLDERCALGAVAQQFGEAIGQPDGLRNALGSTDETGAWVPRRPDPRRYAAELEPHARGDILVGAVFEAFRKIYESRASELRCIATGGTGILPAGRLHPDLVNRLAQEAVRAAQRTMEMCIRALDYLPPVEVTFGDFLRAIVTADVDVAPVDAARFRVAFIDAFRSSGILPTGVGTLSEETLLYAGPEPGGAAGVVSAFVRSVSRRHTPWSLPADRKELWELLETLRNRLERRLRRGAPGAPRRLGTIDLGRDFEVLSFHPRETTGIEGDMTFYWVVKVVQRRGEAKGGRSRAKDAGDVGDASPNMTGVTLIIDADTGRVRYQIESSAVRESGSSRRGSGADLLRAAARGQGGPGPERSLRVFAFDPSFGTALETAGINEVTLSVPWERDAEGRDLLQPGPVGEYLEVVDRDPASRCFYEPVDLAAPHLLAQDGLPPSESNPQFHQQMVYVVAMRTVRNFERALGRLALWSPRRPPRRDAQVREEYVPRLRVYPHALREANAYYSPEKKALLFGYFPAPAAEVDAEGDAPRLTVFTCLSHDIIAHEVTHALLDGMHGRFREPSNPDMPAFHEAFADLVALFQHFSLPEVLRHQIAATRGDLASQNRLGELAQQFGRATGRRGALRSAIGEVDAETGRWRPIEPTVADYQREQEPHARGAVLVAAVFEAFLAIYKARIADLLRCASGGTGVLPAGSLHPALVARLCEEAARAANHVLAMCIRALDYCPPVDLTFGDFLRAIVTADFDHDPIDEEHRRVAFVEAFRRRGIIPEGVPSFSVDGLLWRPAAAAPDEDERVVVDIVTRWAADIDSWKISRDRERLFILTRDRRAQLHEYLRPRLARAGLVLGGLDPSLRFEVHSLRPSQRVDWSGKPRFQWVIELTQRVPQYSDAAAKPGRSVPEYYFRGGCTLLVEADSGKVRYSIKKRLTAARSERQRRYIFDTGNLNLAATYFGGPSRIEAEPFALLHRGLQEIEGGRP